ncbi:hypothetical protein ANN_05634 [Periplaneta americana]|uniref:Uncharacterized protein n=1 Tax=Periplaneta americana TaxID=6978 RepID=A0ABQ8TBC1_PERAM|nr:hypothetical protein ANN_05634 [Periplaneta americana]
MHRYTNIELPDMHKAFGAAYAKDLAKRIYEEQHTQRHIPRRAGPLAWPARSPDMTPVDSCVWGHIKSIVYETPIDTAEQSVARIILAFDDLRNRQQYFEGFVVRSYGVTLFILPVVLYGYETWTLTSRKEHKLRVFENKVFRKIFGAKRDEVTGEWRKLHNTELHALYSSPDIIRNIKSRRLRWEGHIARMGESRNAYRVLVGRPEGKRPLGRPRRRWEDNIKMDLREVEYDGRDWINLPQDRARWRAYVRAGMNLRKAHLYGCETWTLTLREEQRLRVFENKVLRKIFGAKRDEVTAERRKLNTELHALYSLPDIIRNIKSRRYIACTVFSPDPPLVAGILPAAVPLAIVCAGIQLCTHTGRHGTTPDQMSECVCFYFNHAVDAPRALTAALVWAGQPPTSPLFCTTLGQGTETWTLRRSEEKRLEAFEMWIWRRMERVKWTDRIRNKAVLERVGEETMMLKLIRKRKRNWLGHWLRRNCLLKDALEGMVNGRRVRGRRRYQMIDDIKIYGSYEETKRKVENRKDWRMLGLQ